MTTRSLRILHLSDVHFGQTTRNQTNWRLRRVLGKAWQDNLRVIVADGKPDIVCFTGDIAFSGGKGEYKDATAFFDELLNALGVQKSQLFVVPGNHDVDRKVNLPTWKKVRDAIPQTSSTNVAQWMAGGSAPFGFDEDWRGAVLARQHDYRQWLSDCGLAHCIPGGVGQAHPHLGYRATLGGWPQPVHIVGLDSAWLAGDDQDAEKLRITDAQVGRHLTLANGAPIDGLVVVLAHHPISTLADGKDIRGLLNHYRVPFVLHGHVHDPEFARWQPLDSTANSSVECASGCLYESDTFPNGFQVFDVQVPAQGFATLAQVWVRSWTPRNKGRWFSDSSIMDGAIEGRWRQTVAPASRLPASGGCFGRASELATIHRHLLDVEPSADAPHCMVLAGMPGIGKSRLAHTFVREHWAAAPGVSAAEACVRLTLEPNDAAAAVDAASAITAAVALGQRLADQMKVSGNPANLWSSLSAALAASQRLLLIENVDSDAQRLAVGALVARLQGCAVLVTARQRSLGHGAHWAQIDVKPLANEASLELFHDELQGMSGPVPGDTELSELARTLGHLPLALHIAAAHLRDGIAPAAFMDRLVASGFSAEPPPGDAALNEDFARAVLNSSFQLAWDHWQRSPTPTPVPAAQIEALLCFAHAPADGVGESLGAALCALSDADYNAFTVRARRHSLLELADGGGDGGPAPSPRHRMHPLLAAWFRDKADAATTNADSRRNDVLAQLADWLCALMEEGGDQQAKRFAVQQEEAALRHLLLRADARLAIRVEREGNDYAHACGPFAAWAEFCDRHQSQATGVDRSNFLWTLTGLARQSGDLDRALDAARKKRAHDLERGDEREAALAWGAEADVLNDRGELDEALRICREEQLPVYEKLGEVRARAVTLGKIADVLYDRGELDEALRIRREEQLPVYEKLGDVRARAVSLGKIADVLHARGELDEALRIRREEVLPVYEKLGDVRSRAVTLGQIADVLSARGELDEALRILREEELPVYEKLGDVHSLLVGRANVALMLTKRRAVGDLAEAKTLLDAALVAAERLRIPEAATIRGWLERLAKMSGA